MKWTEQIEATQSHTLSINKVTVGRRTFLHF